MKCPGCGYTSFDHLEYCKKCGYKLSKDLSQDITPSTEPATEQPAINFTPPKTTPRKKKIKNRIKGKKGHGLSITQQEADENENHSLGLSVFLPQMMDNKEDDKKEESFEESVLSPATSEDAETVGIRSTKDRTYGGFWIRSLAFVIDLLLISIIQTIFSGAIKLGVITGAGILEMNPKTLLDLRELLITICGAAIMGFYFIYFHGTTGQTPGKKVCHLKVIKMDGGPLGFREATIRFFSYLVSALPLYFGFILVAFQRDKQGLHDLITRTYVIKTKGHRFFNRSS